MTLFELTLWAMLGATPTEADRARLTPVAEAIASEAQGSPLWEGDAGEAATAIALVAIARHESHLRESVRRCQLKGDHGRSVGLFQVQRGWAWDGHDERAICESDRLQAALSLRVLGHYRKSCKSCAPLKLFQAYASGDPAKRSDAAKDTAAMWERIARKAGLQASAAGGEIRWAR